MRLCPGDIFQKMETGQVFDFSCYLVTVPKPINETYSQLAKQIFGFRDFRRNDIASLNTALDNIVDYSLSHFAWFVRQPERLRLFNRCSRRSEKCIQPQSPGTGAGAGRFTDVREKGLSINGIHVVARKIPLRIGQHTKRYKAPSRKLKGPIAPLSELLALYEVFGKKNPFYLELAQRE